MSDKTRAARKSADELAAGAVNGQDNEEIFDADEEARIEAEVERRLDIKFEMAVEAEVEERLERQEEDNAESVEEAVEAEVEKRMERFRESAEFEMAVEEAVEAEIEQRLKATATILAEMREDFRGGDVAGVMAREFADRIEAAVGGKATDNAAMV